MNEVKTIIVKRSAYADNDEEANLLRDYLKSHGTFLVNLMSSPGAGKTTTLTSLINILKKDFRIGVMEADIDSDVDAISIAKNTGVKSIQIHTSGMCHLDAGMTKSGLDGIDISDLDLVFLENVGNLVCPAEFDTGASMDMMILSIPEGDDKPLKYPLVFEKCDLVLINKIDTISYFDFDIEKCRQAILRRNPNATIIPISGKTGENIDKVAEYFSNIIENWKEK
ncbi:MAG: hydrogenase nickel incorporation protein HypB [Erysipelotrichaceae bacterium]|nr:hydrogenase nickel incorporation protein HypB [Erysipelotrichaceae bacterium]